MTAREQLQALLSELDGYATQVVEVQLADYGETAAGGSYVKFRLPEPEDLEPYRGRDRRTQTRPGSRFVLVAIEIDDSEEPTQAPPRRQPAEKGPHGQWWRGLHVHGVFLAPQVCAALGSDDDYQQWCRQQPCAIPTCAFTPRWEVDTWVGCESAHVRRVSRGAGVAEKPPFSELPLCHRHHALQHQGGESAALGTDSPAWWENALRDHLSRWCHERLRLVFETDSLSWVSPEAALAWFAEHELLRFLPEGYRNASRWEDRA